MAFLLFLPFAVFGLVGLLAFSLHIRIEITERRRVMFKPMRKIFRPIIIEGGKGRIVAVDIRQPPVVEETAASIHIKLVI